MQASVDIDARLIPNSQKLLRDDDSLLRHMFFKIFQLYHPKLSNKVDVIYGLAKSWCEDNSIEDFELLVSYIQKLSPIERILVSSAFSHTLNLYNVTEEVFISLAEQAARIETANHPLRATAESMSIMIEKYKIAPEDIYKALCNQSVELVFTAHPTQALRQELLTKYSNMQQILKTLHNVKLSSTERKECLESLNRTVQAAWRTDEIHRRKPTPQNEMINGLAIFQNVIFKTLPILTRRLDMSLEQLGLPHLPLNHVPFKFGSWMGGDRDGNPNVKHDTTREVCIIARLAACDIYLKEIEKLISELSMWRADKNLQDKLKEINLIVLNNEKLDKRVYETFSLPISEKEPYRVILSVIRDKLYKTREILKDSLDNSKTNIKELLNNEKCIRTLADITDPLMLIYDSLKSIGDIDVANGHLLDLIRQVHAFGLCIVKLDIRQEASRHTNVINNITSYLNLGSYKEWNEEEKLEFLVKELQSRRPLLPHDMPMSDEVNEAILTFKTLSELPEDSLGAYVISMAKSASDVLAVMLLQKECGIRNYLRVVPLFETLSDLDNAPDTMRQLFSNDWYHKIIQGRQECMIGYSDSGKDAGRLAAAWALYQTQQKLVAIANEFNIKLTLFHGRGGTVGRGGGPAHLAIKSQPPNTIQGTMRVTIQGETIIEKFGENEVCLRTLDLYTSAVLESTLGVDVNEPETEWIELISKMAKASCDEYRDIVFKNNNFINYFINLCPAKELTTLNIGSRPSSRNNSGGIENLRAIPWIFSWTQTRFHLPVWLGLGAAIKCAIDLNKMDILKQMYQSWHFFQVTLNMVEMVMFKADPRVVSMYENRLVDKSLHGLGEDLRIKFIETKKLLAEVTGHGSLGFSAGSPILSDKIKLRYPYVTPLNVMQVECLRDLRNMQENDVNGAHVSNNDTNEYDLIKEDDEFSQISDALIITIKGISSGMQNTG